MMHVEREAIILALAERHAPLAPMCLMKSGDEITDLLNKIQFEDEFNETKTLRLFRHGSILGVAWKPESLSF
jgi:hypothetical protein